MEEGGEKGGRKRGRKGGGGIYVPEKASSGRTSMSMGGIRLEVWLRRPFALAMFSSTLPSCGENCRHAMRISELNWGFVRMLVAN